MANNGKTSGDGKSSPYGSPGGAGARPSGGNDFVKNPSGQGLKTGGVNKVQDPAGGIDKAGGHNFVKEPGGAMAEVPKQKTGSYSNPSSVPSGGKTPFVKGGAEPAATRTGKDSGFSAGSTPAGGKPFKITKS